MDEVRSGLFIFEQTLWDALPAVRCARSTRRCATATGRPLPLDAAPIVFGSWIGGDRDGNPAITPEVTREACAAARWMAADLYAREIDALGPSCRAARRRSSRARRRAARAAARARRARAA